MAAVQSNIHPLNAAHHTNKFQKYGWADYGGCCLWIANKRASMSQTPFDIQRAAVIGAGTMGRGIVMCLANAGVSVQWVDNNAQMLEQALTTVAETYAHNVRQGRIDQAEADARIARVTAAADYPAIREVDLVIEAVYENLELKQQIFRELDGLLKPEAILASNTSALDIDAIAAATRRPQQVLGLHFFSPAHIMKLLEIVRGAQTAPTVLKAALDLGRRMGKVSVVAGNCHGFIGNRMLNAYVLQARKMLLEGAYPQQVDAALQGFGFAMGPFRMYDVVGIDLGWRARQLAGVGQDEPEVQVENRLCELGRFGQKSGNGYYHYEPGSRQAEHDVEVDALVLQVSEGLGYKRREPGPEESSSAACWRWSMKGRRSFRKALPSQPMTSIWCTSMATVSRQIKAGRWPGRISRAWRISMGGCCGSRLSKVSYGSRRG